MSHYPPQQGYGQPQNHPQLPPGWVAEYDARDRRTVFVNRQTGQRSFDFPHSTYQQQAPYAQQGYPPQQQQQAYYAPQQQQPAPQNSHKAMEYGGLGAVGGVLVGALGMHEWEKHERREEHEHERPYGGERREEYGYGARREGVEVGGYGERREEERREETGEERRYEERRKEMGEERRYEERREDEREEQRDEYREERREDAYEERREDGEERREEYREEYREDRREERFDDY